MKYLSYEIFEYVFDISPRKIFRHKTISYHNNIQNSTGLYQFFHIHIFFLFFFCLEENLPQSFHLCHLRWAWRVDSIDLNTKIIQLEVSEKEKFFFIFFFAQTYYIADYFGFNNYFFAVFFFGK